MDITLPPSPALCCFAPARFLTNILLLLLSFGTMNFGVVSPKVLHRFLLSILVIRAFNTNDKNTSVLVFVRFYFEEETENTNFISFQTMTHEIGHMFGIKHCQWLNCVMQGSNHLEESDRRPLDFCPICLRKLQVSVGFQIPERYKVKKNIFHGTIEFYVTATDSIVLLRCHN